jgi:sugar phosphate isomerase/epimerase
MMKLGLCDSYHHPTQAKLGDNKYAVLKELGFSALDFGLANVDGLFYTAPTDTVQKLLSDIRAQVEDAGLFVSQVHGPWTWPPSYDATQEARRVSLEQMKPSIDMTAALGCRHWVIHPLMTFA